MKEEDWRKLKFGGVAFFVLIIGLASILILRNHYTKEDEFDSTTMVSTVAILTICFFFVQAIWEKYCAGIVKNTTLEKEKEHLTLQKLYESTKDIVKKGFEARCERLGLKSKERKEAALYKKAAESVKASSLGQDVITQAKLESLDKDWIRTLLSIQSSIWWTIFIYIIVLSHLILSFIQSSHLRGDKVTKVGVAKLHLSMNPTAWDSTIEFFFILFELMDVGMRYFGHYYSGGHILFPQSEVYYLYANFGVVFYIFLDWIITLGAHISIEFILPVRPMLLVLMNRTLRMELTCLVHALFEMIPIVVLYAGLVISFGIFSFLLYGDQDSDNYSAWVDAEGEDMKNVIRATVQMFVFLSAGENYTSMVYPALAQGRMGIIFFIIAMFIGIFVFMAMITGIFEHAFSERNMKAKLRKRWWNRTGMVAAYTLIDLNGDGFVSDEEFKKFLQHLCGNEELTNKELEDLMNMLDADRNGRINLNEFVRGLETISFHKLFFKPLVSEQSEFQLEAEKIVESWGYKKAFLLLCICSFWIFALYNKTHAEIIDNLTMGIVIVHTMELFVRIFAFGGPHRYLFLHRYEYCTKRNVDTFAHRWDTALTLIAFFGYIALASLVSKDKITQNAWVRIFPACVLIRFFFRWQTSKELCYMLRSGATIVFSLLVLMASIFFIFGVVGVTFFRNGLEGATEDDKLQPYTFDFANFDTLGNSFILLTQAFLGEAFHELLAVTRYSWGNITGDKESWEGNWFIIIFFFLMSVLFNNLFFGLLLNIFSDLYEAQQDGEELTKELVRNTSMPSIDDADPSESFLVEDLAEPSMSLKLKKLKRTAAASKKVKEDENNVSDVVEIQNLESMDLSQVEMDDDEVL